MEKKKRGRPKKKESKSYNMRITSKEKEIIDCLRSNSKQSDLLKTLLNIKSILEGITPQEIIGIPLLELEVLNKSINEVLKFYE